MYKYSKGINLVAGGEKHRVYVKKSPTGVGKGVKGHVMVNHPTSDKGKWDTIDLTQKAGAKTVEDGKNATKKWHRENPMKMQGGNKSTEAISNTDTSENYSGMQKFYTDLFAAGNKYKNKETGVVGPFNAARALLKASIKNPSVLFSKRHRLKDPQSNPYNVQGYTTKDIFGNTKSWLPTDWNENIVNTEPTKKTAFARYPGNKQNKTGKLIQNRMVNSKRVDNISVTGPSYVSGAKSVKQYRGDENLPEAKNGMKNCGCKHSRSKYKYQRGNNEVEPAEEELYFDQKDVPVKKVKSISSRSTGIDDDLNYFIDYGLPKTTKTKSNNLNTTKPSTKTYPIVSGNKSFSIENTKKVSKPVTAKTLDRATRYFINYAGYGDSVFPGNKRYEIKNGKLVISHRQRYGNENIGYDWKDLTQDEKNKVTTMYENKKRMDAKEKLEKEIAIHNAGLKKNLNPINPNVTESSKQFRKRMGILARTQVQEGIKDFYKSLKERRGYKYGTGALTIPEGSAIVTANGGKNKQALMAYKQGNHKLLNKIIDEMPEDNVDRAKNGIKNTYKKYKFKPGTKNVNAGDEDDAWIKKILTYEAKEGGFDKSTGKAYGLPNWGYNNWQKFGHSRSPRNIEEAIEYFKQDYLPKVKDYPLKLRKKLADYSYNSGRSIEDLLLLADDKINLDEINSNATFTKKWNENKDEILKKLNSPEFIKKLDSARTDVAKTTGTYPDPNDSSKSIRYSLNNPNPAYAATWQGRIANMQDEDETPVVNQNKQNSSVVNPITGEMGTVGPTAVQGNTQGTQQQNIPVVNPTAGQNNNQGAPQQNISPAPVSTVNQNAGTTVTDPNASTTPVGSTGVQNSPVNPNAVPAPVNINPAAPKETWTGTGKTYAYKAKTPGKLDFQPNRFNNPIWSKENYPQWIEKVSAGLEDEKRYNKILDYLKNYKGQDYQDVQRMISENDPVKLKSKIKKLGTDQQTGPFHVALEEAFKETEGEKPGEKPEDEPGKITTTTTTTTGGEGDKITIPEDKGKKGILGSMPTAAEIAARGSLLAQGVENVPENYLKLGRYKYASQLPKTLQEIQLAEQAGRESARNVVGGDAGRYLAQAGNLSSARMKAANDAVIQDTLARQDILNKNVDLGNVEAQTNTGLKNQYAQQRAANRGAYSNQLVALGKAIDTTSDLYNQQKALANADEQRMQILKDLGMSGNYSWEDIGNNIKSLRYRNSPSSTSTGTTTQNTTGTVTKEKKGVKKLRSYKRK